MTEEERLYAEECDCPERLSGPKRNHIVLTNEIKQYLDGELLGDGCMYARSQGNPYFKYSSKHYEYAYWLTYIFHRNGIQTSNVKKRFIKLKNKDKLYLSHSFYTKRYVEFQGVRKRWYPNGKKIVPQDIILTPIVLRQWYIGDGYLQNHRSITLFTDCFSVSNLNLLVANLERIGIKANIQMDRWIYLGARNCEKFFEYIGKCPEEIIGVYGYKWLYSQNPVYKGVYFDKQKGKWSARVQYNKRRYFLGLFSDKNEGIAKVKEFRGEIWKKN